MMRDVPRSACLVVWLGACLVVAGAHSPAAAQPVTTGLQGYGKNLAVRAQSFFSGDPYLLDVSRLRLNGYADVGRRLHGELWLDTELLLGSYLGTQDYALSRSFERPTLAKLDWTLADGDRFSLRQRLFRAFVTAYLDRVQLTVGRQRIAWGTGFVWNPTDLLNPINPSAIEREEKEGVDAVYGSLALGTLSRVEAVAAPGRRAGTTSVAAKATTNVGEYDVSAMGGRFRGDWVIGGDFAGYVGDGGLRGEAALTIPDGARSYVRATLNTDYNFRGGYYAFVEMHYNGAGTRDKSKYDYTALLSGTLFNVAQWYGAASVTKSLTPLVTATVYALTNLDDRSGLVGPGVVWSMAENLELTANTYLFVGSNDTEFGAQSNVYFVSLQYYF